MADHVCYSIETCQRQRALQQTKQPRQTIRPACRVGEVGEDILRGGIIRSCTCQDCDRDDDEASNGPDQSNLIDHRQEPISERIDRERDQRSPNINQKLMPPLRLIARMLQLRNIQDNARFDHSIGCHQRYPSSQIDPSRHPAQPSLQGRRRHHSDPMVLSACCGICRQELCERRS